MVIGQEESHRMELTEEVVRGVQRMMLTHRLMEEGQRLWSHMEGMWGMSRDAPIK